MSKKETVTQSAPKRKAEPKPAAKAPAKSAKPTATKSKESRAIAMMRRPAGATLEQLTKALGWQPHTVRGFVAGALKKRKGIEVESFKSDKGKRSYRINAAVEV